MVDTTIGESTEVLSEDEAALYDRQIRLWGLEAQRRLHSARVLIMGVNGLGAEVAKNLVLAGLHSCMLADDVVVAREHMGINFLLPRTAVGRNRAEVAIDRVCSLNPKVEVSSSTSLPDISEIVNLKYDVVVCCLDSNRPGAYDLMLQYSTACHQAGIKFFTGQVFGYHGFAFVDLKKHEYVVEEKKLPSVKNEVETEPESVMIKKEMSFASLDAVLSNRVHANDTITTKKRLKLLYLMQVLHQYVDKNKGAPSAEDIDTLVEMWISFAQENGLDPGILASTDLELSCLSSLPAVNAIMGGLIAQEVIKAISHKEAPLGNFIFFDGGTSCAIVDLYTPQTNNKTE